MTIDYITHGKGRDARHHTKSLARSCADCKAGGLVVTPPAAKPHAGERHEAAMIAAIGAHYPVLTFAAWLRQCELGLYVRDMPGILNTACVIQYPWGMSLVEPRKFKADAAFPRERLLCEVEGIAHKIGDKRERDIKRRQLAEAAGWRVLSVLPSQVQDGTAVELVRAALSRDGGDRG